MEGAPPAVPNRPKSRKERPLTWEHPTGSGVKITRLANKTGGKAYGESFRVTIPAALLGKTGIRERHQKKTRAEAERFAEDRVLALRKHGTSFADIPPKAQKEAAIAWGRLSEHGISFVEAAEVALRVLRPPGGSRTVAQVTAELLQSKKERLDRRELDRRTHDDFKSRTARIDETFGASLVSAVTTDEVTRWLRAIRTTGFPGDDKPLSQRSVLNYRNTLSEVFRHAKAKRYRTDSPLDYFTREDYKALGGEKAARNLDEINILRLPRFGGQRPARVDV